jgi:hypothetical protein
LTPAPLHIRQLPDQLHTRQLPDLLHSTSASFQTRSTSTSFQTRSAPHLLTKKADIRTRPVNNHFLNFLFYFNQIHIQYIYL